MARNTDLADVNEIYTAFMLNKNKFPDSASEAQYNKKSELLDQKDVLNQLLMFGEEEGVLVTTAIKKLYKVNQEYKEGK